MFSLKRCPLSLFLYLNFRRMQITLKYFNDVCASGWNVFNFDVNSNTDLVFKAREFTNHLYFITRSKYCLIDSDKFIAFLVLSM